MNRNEIFASILDMVSGETEISTTEILSRNKSREVVDARHLFIVLLHDAGFYPSQIALSFGMTCRSITYAITNFGNRILCEKILRRNYEKLKKQLGNT